MQKRIFSKPKQQTQNKCWMTFQPSVHLQIFDGNENESKTCNKSDRPKIQAPLSVDVESM